MTAMATLGRLTAADGVAFAEAMSGAYGPTLAQLIATTPFDNPGLRVW